MPKSKGIQLNENGGDAIFDLKINTVRNTDGKIVSGLTIGSTLEQNKALILLAHQGEFKFNPDLGVGIEDLMLSEDYLAFRHRIREHLKKDGLSVTRLDLYENKPIRIDADY